MKTNISTNLLATLSIVLTMILSQQNAHGQKKYSYNYDANSNLPNHKSILKFVTNNALKVNALLRSDNILIQTDSLGSVIWDRQLFENSSMYINGGDDTVYEYSDQRSSLKMNINNDYLTNLTYSSNIAITTYPNGNPTSVLDNPCFSINIVDSNATIVSSKCFYDSVPLLLNDVCFHQNSQCEYIAYIIGNPNIVNADMKLGVSKIQFDGKMVFTSIFSEPTLYMNKSSIVVNNDFVFIKTVDSAMNNILIKMDTSGTILKCIKLDNSHAYNFSRLSITNNGFLGMAFEVNSMNSYLGYILFDTLLNIVVCKSISFDNALEDSPILFAHDTNFVFSFKNHRPQIQLGLNKFDSTYNVCCEIDELGNLLNARKWRTSVSSSTNTSNYSDFAGILFSDQNNNIAYTGYSQWNQVLQNVSNHEFHKLDRYFNLCAQTAHQIALSDSAINLSSNILAITTTSKPLLEHLRNYSTDTLSIYTQLLCSSYTGINNVDNSNHYLDVYPNPVNDILNIKSLDKINEIYIYDELGRSAFVEKGLNNDSAQIVTNKLARGFYVCQINTIKRSYFKKILIN